MDTVFEIEEGRKIIKDGNVWTSSKGILWADDHAGVAVILNITKKGRSSDTRVWANPGIQSVNLSAGYLNEHTDRESLDVAVCYETVKLIKGVLKKGESLRGFCGILNGSG